MNPNIVKVSKFILKYLYGSMDYTHDTCIEIKYDNITIFVNYDSINIYEYNGSIHLPIYYPMVTDDTDLKLILSKYKRKPSWIID